jgi:hypothetical protein
MPNNNLLTDSIITKKAVRLFVNSNLFIQNIDRQYDSRFAVEGAKIGDTLRIRLPNDYTVADGPAASVQNTEEKQTTLTIQYQRHVDVAFTSSDRALKLDDFGERVALPMMNDLAGDVALQIMSDSEGKIPNFVSATNAGAIITPTASTVLTARAILAANSAPMGRGRKLIVDPFTDAQVTASLTQYFNPSQAISQQYRDGTMKNALGFDWYEDQTVLKHTSGSFTAGTVFGAGQTGNTLVTNAITGTLLIGDIITIDGVNSVNRVTKQDNGRAMQFVVTADVANLGTAIQVYPAITPAVGGNAVQYQTVTASPGNGAAITLATQPNEVYVRNFGYVPEAVTMATADLFLPKGVIDAGRSVYDGISLRMVSQYAIGTDQAITRCDVIFGSQWPRGEWGVIVANAV